jgi:hypothetical protein
VDILRAAVGAATPLAVVDTPVAGIAKSRDAAAGNFYRRVAVNEVKTEAREGVLNGAPFLLPRSYGLA